MGQQPMANPTTRRVDDWILKQKNMKEWKENEETIVARTWIVAVDDNSIFEDNGTR